MRADLERSLKTRLLMHTESLNGAEEEEQEDKVHTFFESLENLLCKVPERELLVSKKSFNYSNFR